eukprot:scaffold103827_cov29-Tisochrysis_lutea.AAC.3
MPLSVAWQWTGRASSSAASSPLPCPRQWEWAACPRLAYGRARQLWARERTSRARSLRHLAIRRGESDPSRIQGCQARWPWRDADT